MCVNRVAILRHGTNGNEEIIRILLYGGADLTLKGKDGKTPLDLAMESGDEKTINSMLYKVYYGIIILTN